VLENAYRRIALIFPGTPVPQGEAGHG